MLDGCPARAAYSAGGSHVVAEDHGFVTRDGKTGYEWRIELSLTRRWEGLVKFYAVLLSAFAMPHRAAVTIGGQVFTDRESLRDYAEAVVTQLVPLDELIDHGVARPGEGLQFV